jgi:hypothetical protein
MTKKELKEKIERLCVEYAKEYGLRFGHIVVGVMIEPDEVDSNITITRYVSSNDKGVC